MWAQIAVAAGSQILGSLFGRKDRRRARQAEAQQAAILAEMRRIGEQQMQRGQALINRWDQEFSPVVREAIDAARQTGRANLEAVTADNSAAFEAMRGRAERDLRRAGMTPADGGWLNMTDQANNAEALSLVTGRNQERARAGMQRANAMISASQLGNPLLNLGADIERAGLGFMGGAMGNQAGLLGDQAGRARESAAGWQAALGNLAGQAIGGMGGGKSGTATGPAPDVRIAGVQPPGKMNVSIPNVATRGMSIGGMPWDRFVNRGMSMAMRRFAGGAGNKWTQGAY